MRKIALLFCSLLLLALSSYLFLYNLGQHSISAASDEVIYARVIQNILHNGDILPLRHGGFPFYEKPPLKFWLTSIIPLLLGESNLSLRLFDGLLGIVSIAISVLVSYRIFGSWAGALVIGFLLLGAPEWVVSHHSFRRVVLDGLLTLEILVASVFAWRAFSSLERGCSAQRDLILFSCCCALATLTKSVAGLIPIALMATLLILSKKGRAHLGSSFFALSIAPLVFLLYVGVVFLQGHHALDSFLGMEIFHRVVHGFTGHNTGDPWYYFSYLFVRGGVTPRALLILGLIGSLCACVTQPAFRFILVWSVVPLVMYSLSSSKAPWYLNPYMPFISMISTFGTFWLIKKISEAKIKGEILLISFTSVLSLPAYFRALDHHCSTVANQTQRIAIDLVSEAIIRQQIPVIFFANAISGRVAPVNGRFNIEGIYRQMLLPQARITKRVSDIDLSRKQYVFIDKGLIGILPPGWLEYRELPPFGPRRHSVLVVRYEKNKIEPEDLRKQ